MRHRALTRQEAEVSVSFTIEQGWKEAYREQVDKEHRVDALVSAGDERRG